MRNPLTKLQRVKLFDKHEGRCHLCQLKIHVGEIWEVEHVKPLHLGGEDLIENMAPAHIKCHKIKSGEELTIKAKTDRVRAKHLGIKKKSRMGYKLFNGTPVHP